MNYELKFLLALAMTLVVEVPILYLIYKLKYKISSKNVIFVGVLASTLTLPYFWFIFPVYFSHRLPYLIGGELLIFIFEAIIYWRLLDLKFSQSLFVSLFANICSVLIGLMLF